MKIIAKLLVALSGSHLSLKINEYPKHLDWENFRFIEKDKNKAIVAITDQFGITIMGFKEMDFDEVMTFIQNSLTKKMVEKEIDDIVNKQNLT